MCGPPVVPSPTRILCCALLLAGLLSADASALTPSAHKGRAGACRPGTRGGPACQVWMAKVKTINDGDTIGVDIDGDGSHRVFQIRFTGVQAMEETVYSNDPHKLRGQCHAVPAALFVYKLMRKGHRRVRLTSQHPMTDSEGRLFRYLAVRYGGRWDCVGQAGVGPGFSRWVISTTRPPWEQ